jgi:hypothetical protein
MMEVWEAHGSTYNKHNSNTFLAINPGKIGDSTYKIHPGKQLGGLLADLFCKRNGEVI